MRISGKKLLLGFATLGLFGTTALAADAPRTVSVSGACIRSVVPNRAAVVLMVDEKDADAKRAQVAATRRYESIRGKISAFRLPEGEMTTVEFHSEEIREWEKNKLISKGFRTRIGLRVETSDQARLGEVIEMASREGIKQISGLKLFVSTKKMLEEKMGCLKEASEQARAKAESLVKALSAKLGEVQTIMETSGPDSPSPMMMMDQGMMKNSAMDAAPQIEPGKTEITTTVQVTFGLM